MKKLLFPLLSISTFCIGNSIMFTLLAVNLDKAGASINMIGALTTAYFVGIAIGIFTLNKVIIRVGHIRSFAGFCAGIIIIFISHSLIIEQYLWLFMRLLGGIVIGGLLLTIESWMIRVSENGNRGRILSFYMIAIYIGYILGQLCFELPIMNLKLYSLATIACAMAIIPLTITNVPQPRIEQPDILPLIKLFQISHVGLLTTFSAGMIMSTIYGLLPIFFLMKVNDALGSIGIYMAVTFIGGMLLQYPLGKLSDKVNRPLLLAIIYLSIIILSILIMLLFQYQIAALIFLFLFGGLSFAVYPISVSHTCDKLNEKQFLSGIQSLLLLYSSGAAIGPLIAPLFMELMGVNGLFIYFIIVSTLLGLFIAIFRLTKKLQRPEEPYITIPMGTTHIATHVDPRVINEQKNTTESDGITQHNRI